MNTNNSKAGRRSSLRASIRTTWAIAWKDIVEALKNKTTLAVLLTTIPMIFVYYYLPRLGARADLPLVRVYDAGNSVLVARLENSSVIDIRTYSSEEQMKAALASGDVPQIALTIPAGFDQALAESGQAQLLGYVLNWVSQGDADRLRQMVENEATFQMSLPVGITLQDRVYMQPESTGMGTSAAMSWVFVITMVGLILTPHLMLEEKLTHTIDMLMISPASSGSLVAGKAIAGLFYCLLGAGVALVFYHWLVLHWWLILVATVLGALFATSVGLILGSLINSRAQLSMLAWIFILPLLVPVILALLPGLIPDRAIAILSLFPTVVFLDLLRTSFAAVVPVGPTLLRIAWLAALAGGGLLISIWLVRRKERQPGKTAAEFQIEETSATPILDAGKRWLASRSARLSQVQAQPVAVPGGMDAAQMGSSEVTAGKRDGWRILWAIAAKDINATLRSKLAISIMIGTAAVLATGALFPMLLRVRNTPAAIVYDEGHSTILRALATSDDLRLGVTNSLEEMQEIVSGSQEMLLGLIVPEDFDSRAGSADTIELEAYAVHWADPKVVAERVAFFEEQLGNSTWGQVQIHVAEQRLYPLAKLQGQMWMFSLTATIILFTMGIALVPLLFVEERQAHTLEMLLISPARLSEVVAGKALAGGFYCLLAAVIIFMFNQYLVVHWWVVLLAVLLGSALAVAIGLLVGLISETPTTMGLWGSLIFLGMIALTFMGTYGGISWSPTIDLLLDYLPTSAMIELLGFSLAGEIPAPQIWANAAVMMTAVLVVLGLVGLRLRQTDR